MKGFVLDTTLASAVEKQLLIATPASLPSKIYPWLFEWNPNECFFLPESMWLDLFVIVSVESPRSISHAFHLTAQSFGIKCIPYLIYTYAVQGRCVYHLPSHNWWEQSAKRQPEWLNLVRLRKAGKLVRSYELRTIIIQEWVRNNHIKKWNSEDILVGDDVIFHSTSTSTLSLKVVEALYSWFSCSRHHW